MMTLRTLPLTLALLLLPAMTAAQTGTSVSSESAPAPLEAVITGPSDVAVGRTLVLDASSTRTTGTIEAYEWFVEGRRQSISQTVEAIFTPESAGTLTFRLVVRAKLPDGSIVRNETTHVAIAYVRKIILLADETVAGDKLAHHQQTAADAGIFLQVLRPTAVATPIGSEETLVKLLTDQGTALGNAEAIVIWTEGVRGLQALMRVTRENEELATQLRDRSIVVIADGGLSTLARVARGPYTVIRPTQILLTRKEALTTLLATPTIDAFLTELQNLDVEYLRLDATTAAVRPWNLLSTLVNMMLIHGVPSQTAILLLALPVIATILTFLKQVVGVTTFGLYTPSIIALSFLALGWGTGVLFLLFILVTGYATRAIMRRWRLLYIPKVAIILTAVSVTLLVLMGVTASYGVTFSRETVFILLIMSTLAESFLNLKTEQGMWAAVLGVAETILAALLCVFIVQWPAFQSVLLAYPELLIFTLVVNAILGRWTGLRLVEYFRFREVFRHLEE